MRVSYMKPGRRAREERLVSREFPDYKTDDRGEPSDASAEEVRTYVSHRFVVAAVSILQRCGWRSQRREAICRAQLSSKCRSDGGGSAYCAALSGIDEIWLKTSQRTLSRLGRACFAFSLVCYIPLASRPGQKIKSCQLQAASTR